MPAMVAVAVDGEPGTTAETPTGVPSSEKVTVPVGSVEPVIVGVIVADTPRALPPGGVIVAGVTTRAVVLLGMVTVVAVEVELL